MITSVSSDWILQCAENIKQLKVLFNSTPIKQRNIGKIQAAGGKKKCSCEVKILGLITKYI